MSTHVVVTETDRLVEQRANGSAPRHHRPGFLRRIHPAWLVQGLAVVPVAAMANLILPSSQLQRYDYWDVLPRVVNPDGSLAMSQLLFFHNEHVLTIPAVVYWLNYKISSGLNAPLGLFVVALALGQAVMLRILLPRAPRVGRWAASLLFVAFTVLLLAPQGAHNFVRAMSGTAWLLANVFSVAALLVASRARPQWVVMAALPLALLATLSYGTGLMAWPALLVVTVLRWRRWSFVHAIVLAASVVALGTYVHFYERPPAHPVVALDPVEIARRVLQVLGSAVAPDLETAVILGAVAVALASFLAVRAVQLDRVAAAPWVGLLVYSVFGAALIGRSRVGANVGVSSRYASLSALCWCAVLVLAAWVWSRDRFVLPAAAVVVGLAFVGGQTAIEEIRQTNPLQDEIAIALRLGVVEDYPPLLRRPLSENRGWLSAIGHYPFSDAFDDDCGMLGQRLETGPPHAAGDGATGSLDDFLAPYNDQSMRMTGWAAGIAAPVRCVLVVGGDLEVIGAGTYGTERVDLVLDGHSPSGNANLGFNAVALAGERSYRALVVLDDGQLVWLPGVLSGSVEAVD